MSLLGIYTQYHVLSGYLYAIACPYWVFICNSMSLMGIYMQ